MLIMPLAILLSLSVASLGGRRRGRTAPGDTLQGLTPDLKLIFLFLNLERTLDKRRGKMGVVQERTAKKVAASGDTINPSDATYGSLSLSQQGVARILAALV